MNIETNPSAQMPPGKARYDPNAAREDWLLFDGAVFIWGIIPADVTAYSSATAFCSRPGWVRVSFTQARL